MDTRVSSSQSGLRQKPSEYKLTAKSSAPPNNDEQRHVQQFSSVTKNGTNGGEPLTSREDAKLVSGIVHELETGLNETVSYFQT